VGSTLARGLLLCVLLLGLLPRLPLLYNAAALSNSDAAVDALTIRHLVAGEPRLYPWGVTYYGLTAGLVAVPFAAVLGFTPMAFRLAEVAELLALLAAVYLLARKTYDGRAGIIAAALLALFSPQAVRWSCLTAATISLILAWGTLALLWHERLRRRPVRGPEIFAFGCFAGLGLYTYELFLIYLAALACAWSLLAAAGLVRLARGRDGPARQATRRLRSGLFAALCFGGGLALGWAPKLAVLLAGAARGSHEPGYGFAGAAQVARNARLLGLDLLALLGANPGADPALLELVGSASAMAAALGAVLLAVYAAAWLDAARRVLSGAWREPARVVAAEGVLVLLVPVNLALFLLSTNPNDIQSSHYLLPLLSSLPVLAGGFLVRLARRSPAWAAAAGGLAVVMLGLPAVQIYHWENRLGVLDPRLRPVPRHEPLTDVIHYLELQGTRGAYAEYWTCYKATFLAQEKVVVAPLLTWDRYPAYGQQVDSLPAEAYIFHSRFPGGQHGEEQVVAELRARGRPFAVRAFGPYRVYTSLDHRRLLPPPCQPEPLPALEAGLTAVRFPTSAAPGERLEIPATLANRGARTWSAAGLGVPFAVGIYRVELVYRWLDQGGRHAIAQAEAGRLPHDLAPGEAASLVARVPAPERSGSYELLLYAAQAGVPRSPDAADRGAVSHPVEIAAGGR
jgi:Dolichyl-phosphate-mannose-protein mannosyltransferase